MATAIAKAMEAEPESVTQTCASRREMTRRSRSGRIRPMGISEAAVQDLLASRPEMHQVGATAPVWGLPQPALKWLTANLEPGCTTLETGCGMSTAAFALRAGAHFVISPNFFGEQEAVCQWLGERDIQVEHVRFIQGRSQDVLPNLEVPPLDAVLIDGGHAFPLPYIDWLFACRHLQPGGRLIIDDMHIRPCALLREFLEMEEGRWRLVADLGATVVFEKLTRRLLPDDDWTGQPWSVMSNRPDKRRRLRALLRHSA